MALTYFISRRFPFDYGFFGAIIPVFASIFRMPENAPERLKLLDNHLIHVAMLGLGVLIHALESSNIRIQLHALLAIFILLLYSGKRGKLKLKYFFYIFYPTHIAVLQIIYWIINA